MRTVYFLFLFCFIGVTANASTVVKIHIDDVISIVMADYVISGIDYAQKTKADAVLIEMNTPGGLLEATRDIVQSMLASKIPTIVFVGPSGARAGSAGVFITLAADVAAMATSTNIGAAHPVSVFGGDIEGDMREKIENDTAAWARSLAEGKNRNADWAEKAVRESVSISESDAVQKHVIDYVAKDIETLLKILNRESLNIHGKKIILNFDDVKVNQYEMSRQQEVVKWLSDPDLIFLLMIIGFLCLFIEFQIPGFGLPGIIGGLCLIFVFGVQLLPINWIGALMILGGVALFVAEIYVVSLGFLSIGGFALFIFGSFLLFDVPGSSIRVESMLVWIFSALMLLLFLSIGYLLVRAKRQRPTSGVQTLKGKIAEVYEPIVPPKAGMIYCQGVYWQAHADEEIKANAQVEIIRMDGSHAFVKKIDLKGEGNGV